MVGGQVVKLLNRHGSSIPGWCPVLTGKVEDTLCSSVLVEFVQLLKVEDKRPRGMMSLVRSCRKGYTNLCYTIIFVASSFFI